MNKKFFLLIVFILGIAVFYNYQFLPKTFFQQDEWGAFSLYLFWRSIGLKEAFQNFILTDVALHFTPLANIFLYLQFKLFGLNFSPYAYFSLGLHTLNSVLVCLWAFLLFRRWYLAVIAGLIFAVNSISHQAVSWVGTTVNSGGSCLFLLLTLIFFYEDLKQPKIKWLFLFLLSLITALGFKETTGFLFIFMPLFWLTFSSAKGFAFFKKPILPLFVVGFLYLGLRIMLLFNSAAYVFQAGSFPPPPKIIYLYRLLVTPLRAISQSLWGEKGTLDLAQLTVKLGYPDFQKQIGTTASDLFTQTVVADLVSFSLSVFVIFIGLVLFRYFKRLKEDHLARATALAIIFIALSSLPFAFIPGKAGYFSILEPRHLYISLIGSSIFMALFLFGLSHWLAVKTKKSIYLYFLFLLVPILAYHIKTTREDLKILVDRGQIRKEILAKIKNTYPDLPARAVFYVESDTAYYGFPDSKRNLPFQVGPGKILLIWYYNQKKYPPCFYNDLFLYKLVDSQGYRECQGRGFGYFRDYDKLVEILKTNNLSTENVFAFSWFGGTRQLQNVTDRLREEIKKEK